jgi:CheY-like chemotaxis protein
MRDPLARQRCDQTRAPASSPGPEQEQSIERAQQAAMDQGREAAGPRHILLVDDDHALRLLLTELLEEEGFQVTPAADGEAALAVLQTTVPDVLLTDYHMPRLDGLGLLRAVHQHWPLLPVVFCTGEAEMEGQVRGYDQVTFLCKPLDLKQVLHHIERAVQSQGDPGGATVGSP